MELSGEAVLFLEGPVCYVLKAYPFVKNSSEANCESVLVVRSGWRRLAVWFVGREGSHSISLQAPQEASSGACDDPRKATRTSTEYGPVVIPLGWGLDVHGEHDGEGHRVAQLVGGGHIWWVFARLGGEGTSGAFNSTYLLAISPGDWLC